MRRTDREVTARAEIDAIIRGSLVCRVALAKDNLPYLVPLCFGYDGAALYVHTAAEGKKIVHFEANQQVCFEFERNVELRRDPLSACKWSMSYECVIGYGTISELLEPLAKERALNELMRQYSGKNWPFDAVAVAAVRIWKVEITSMAGKQSVPKITAQP
jgi:nitroimidazol reductase NimA-like FMN-containing flavoprotein (pyridoxamine 5'-phosphate oxidase superfamily)